MVATSETKRSPLSRERILEAAVELADNEGLSSLTMRNLAERLGVEAMSLYHHVANKEALLDGVVDEIISEMVDELTESPGPDPEADWQAAMRHRILIARSVMMKHKWAPTVLETRVNMPVSVVVYFNDLLGIFVKGGFDYDLAHHAMHALGSRALGFSQELFNPGGQEDVEAANDEMLESMAEQLPYLFGMLAEVMHDGPDETLGWCDDETEFRFALDLLLDGLERARRRSA